MDLPGQKVGHEVDHRVEWLLNRAHLEQNHRNIDARGNTHGVNLLEEGKSPVCADAKILVACYG